MKKKKKHQGDWNDLRQVSEESRIHQQGKIEGVAESAWGCGEVEREHTWNGKDTAYIQIR